MAVKNPESLKETKQVKITDDIRRFVSELSKDIDSEQSNRGSWESKVDKYRAARYGIRKEKVHPWPKCANYVLTLIDEDITKIKPAYVNLMSVTPVVNYVPYGAEDVDPSRARETLFDWRLRTKVKPFTPYNYGVDNCLEIGAAVFKVVWKFESRSYTEKIDINEFEKKVVDALYDPRLNDQMIQRIIIEEFGIDTDYEENIEEVNKAVEKFREGETVFELQLLETKENRAQLVSRDLREDLVIPVDTEIDEDNLDSARWIDDKIWKTKNDILIAIKDDIYESYTDSEIDSWDSPKRYDSTEADQDDLVLIHETCCYYDIDGKGIKRKCIVTWPDGDPSSVLRFIELPFDHGQWPYTIIKRELTNRNVYGSRGIPQLDYDYQKGISTSFNQAIDNGTIVNTPHVVYKRNAVSNIRNRRYVPGEATEIKTNMGDYEVRQYGNASQGVLFQQAQMLKSWANQRLGSVTSGTSDPTNLVGQGQGGNKTKFEVQMSNLDKGQSVSLDLQIFQNQMGRVYAQIDALYDQFGDDVEEVRITGQAPVKTNRKAIQGKFDMVPNGRLDNNNPLFRAQKNIQIKQLFTGNPNIKQDELDRMILMDLDPRVAEKVIMSPEEQQQRAQVQMQQQAMMEQKILRDSVRNTRIGNALEVEKAIALEPIEGAKFKEG